MFNWTDVHTFLDRSRMADFSRLVRKAIGDGDDIDAYDWLGSTLLIYAVRYGSKPAFSALINAGADIGAKDRSGKTALHTAVVYKMPSAVPILLAAGANAGAADDFGQTPLHLAAIYAYRGIDIEQTVIPLLAAGADIECPDISGDTPLMEAVRHKNRRLITLLIKSGADVFHANAKGKTASDICMETLWSSETQCDAVMRQLASAGRKQAALKKKLLECAETCDADFEI